MEAVQTNRVFRDERTVPARIAPTRVPGDQRYYGFGWVLVMPATMAFLAVAIAVMSSISRGAVAQ